MKLLLGLAPLAILYFLCPVQAQGQSPIAIRGSVADSLSGSVLPFANVALFNARDSLVGGVVTDEDGHFALNNVVSGRYRIRITYLGYANTEIVRNFEADTDLGKIGMKSASENLKEVVVQGQAVAAKQKGDTAEFNAGSYKVNPDATTEDLVGKMPGVTMENGQIKARGEAVQQVLVDGKVFFGDDPSQALQNLPADMVHKIQVFDQLSDQAQFTGFDDGNRKKTINIITKQSRRKGNFGKVYAGYGPGTNSADGKYAAGLALNRFDGERRITVLSQANNINQQNFQSTDLLGVLNTQGGRGAGGAGRGGQGRGGPGGGGGGGNFNVGQQSGITTTTAAGLNFTDKPSTWLEINGSYFFNRAANIANQLTNRSYISTAGSQAREQAGLMYREQSLDRSINLNHRANLRATFTLDSANIILLRPRINIQNNSLTSGSDGQSSLANALVSRTLNDYASGQNAIDFSNDVEYRHRFGKPGRTVSLNINTGINSQKGLTNRTTLNQYFNLDSLTGDSTQQQSRLLQDVDSRSKNVTLGSSLSYTEPLSKKAILQLTYRANNQDRTSSRYTHNLDGGRVVIDSLSNALTSNYLANEFGTGIRFNLEKIKMGYNLEYQHADLNTKQTFPFSSNVKRSFDAILPQADIQYRMSDRRNLSFNLRSSTQVPSVTQLQAVVNNINPLQLSTGNPNLNQQYQNVGLLRYSSTTVGTGVSFTAMASGTYVRNYIGNSTTLAQRDTLVINGLALPPGTQLTRPENLGSQYATYAFASFGLPITPIKSNLNLSGNYNYTNTPSLINGRRNESNNNTFAGRVGLSSNINEAVDFTISSSTSYNTVQNTVQKTLDFNYLSQATSLRLNLIFWKSWVLGSQITHTYYNGLSAGFNQNYILWNASIARKFLKDNAAEIRLNVFDILGQNNSIVRTVSDVYVEDTHTNVLQRYFMLTFSYTLRQFKSGAPPTGPSDREMRERREGGPPPGMPGSGPPPGGGPF